MSSIDVLCCLVIVAGCCAGDAGRRREKAFKQQEQEMLKERVERLESKMVYEPVRRKSV